MGFLFLMLLSFISSLYILGVTPYWITIWKSLLPFDRLSSFCWWFSLLFRSFLVWCHPICLFLFPLPEETYSDRYCEGYCQWCPASFRSFMVSGLTVKSLLHFAFFFFLYGVRRWSSFILLHVMTVRASQHHVLKRLSCLQYMFFVCYFKLIILTCMGLFLGFQFCFVYLYVCSASSMLFCYYSFVIFSITLAIWDLLCFHINFGIFLKCIIGILIGIALNM